ncbi:MULTISPECIES: NUDIX hydrolase [Bacillaceae]|uniref:NTP pyrophosphohydrolase n=1 Tax=Alkalicoccobacillus plakortidis TaxID=444060 RepID=A0A9D5DTU9_9BACI|nr:MULTISPECIES: NUDIX hydrolase [Bacillaceae]KQL59160.1 NTP pyrophosphohydrolase [Alkalicoccobacillus plakortidis]
MDYIKMIRNKVGSDPIILNFAGICVVNEKGQILLQKRGDCNQWGFPGGAMEIGESLAECAKREVLEETGLHVEIDYLIGVYSNYFTTYSNGDQAQTVLHFFKGYPVKGSLNVDGVETVELAFVDPEHAPPLFNQQHQDCLADYRSNEKGCFR